MTSKPVEVRTPITELHYIGWAKIKTNGHRWRTQTDVISHWPSITKASSKNLNKTPGLFNIISVIMTCFHLTNFLGEEIFCALPFRNKVTDEKTEHCNLTRKYMCLFLKFIYSEKATKFCEIFPLLLTTVHTVKS